MNVQKCIRKILILLICLLPLNSVRAQSDTVSVKKLVVITTQDGAEFIGEILSDDPREVMLLTRDKGKIIIPKYQIKEMKEIEKGDMNLNGDYIPSEVFSTRYFISTNGLPIKRGESYIQWNLWGPDFEFGVAKNFSVGVMSTWLAYPVVATAKYSIPLGGNTSMALGALAGTSTWGSSELSFGMALPFASLTLGDRKRNLSFSGGYGATWINGGYGGSALLSVAGMSKLGPRVSFVFDSFIVPPGPQGEGGGLIIPGLRFQTSPDKAFQFGFAGYYSGGETLPFPLPFVQWFRRI